MHMARRKTIGRNPLAEVSVEAHSWAEPPLLSAAESAVPPPSALTDPADPHRAFELWAVAAQATLRATVEAQNALLASSLAAVETIAVGEHAFLRYWSSLAEQVEQAALAVTVGARHS